MHAVEVGSLEHRIAMHGEIAVALIIREDENDVGPATSQFLGRGRSAASHKRGNENSTEIAEAIHRRWERREGCRPVRPIGR